MSYVDIAAVEGRIPPDFLTQALDDNGDGVRDAGAWEQVQAAVGNEIDGRLGATYPTPFGTPPAIVLAAGLAIACDLLFKRRGMARAPENPWQVDADAWREKLDKIGAGKEPLGPGYERKNESGAAITEDSRIHSDQVLV